MTETMKLRLDGGLKLVDIKMKSYSLKIKWLMEMCVEQKLSIHLDLFTQLLGPQKSQIQGKDLFFVPTYYVDMSLNTSSAFYKEAIRAMSTLNLKKAILEASKEHVCYNRAIMIRSTVRNKPVIEGNIAHLKCVFFGEILDEVRKRQDGEPYSKKHTNFYDKLDITGLDNKKDYILQLPHTSLTFGQVTQKILYETLLVKKSTYKPHHHVQKWNDRMGNQLDWKKVWATVHNKTSFESTKSAVWEQIHLNFPTQYSFNKWFSTTLRCSLCGQDPQNIFHVILDCTFTNQLWTDLAPVLLRIDTTPITDMEKAFGIMSSTPKATLRNWLTYILRELIETQEKRAYYNHDYSSNMKEFKMKYNRKVDKLIHQIFRSYERAGNVDTFNKDFRIGDVLITETEDGDTSVNHLFPIH